MHLTQFADYATSAHGHEETCKPGAAKSACCIRCNGEGTCEGSQIQNITIETIGDFKEAAKKFSKVESSAKNFDQAFDPGNKKSTQASRLKARSKFIEAVNEAHVAAQQALDAGDNLAENAPYL